MGLWPLASYDCGFESRLGALILVSCECCVLSGRGLCIRLITRPEESYRVWCVWVWSWILDNEEATGVVATWWKNMSTSDHTASVAGRWVRRKRSWPTPDNSRVSFWRDWANPWRPVFIRTDLWAKIWTEHILSKGTDLHHFPNLLAFRILTCSLGTTGINCT